MLVPCAFNAHLKWYISNKLNLLFNFIVSNSLRFMKCITYFFLFFLLSILGLRIMAQNTHIDSLKYIVDTAKNDTTKLDAYSNLMAEFAPTSSEYIAYTNQIGEIILRNLKDKNQDPQTRRNIIGFLGYWYIDKAVELFSLEKKEIVLDYCNNAIAIFNYLEMYDELWNAVSNKAAALREMGRYEEAIASLYKAIKYHESAGNEYGIYLVNMQLAAVYEDQGDNINAILCYKKMLKRLDAIKNPDGLDLNDMALHNSNIGIAYFNQDKYKEARPYIYKAIEIAKKNNLLNTLSFSYSVLGNIYVNERDYEKANANFKEALQYAESNEAKGNLWLSIADMYYHQKKYKLAENYFEDALSVKLKAGQYHTALTSTYSGLYKTYKATGQFEKSLKMLEKYHQTIDSTKIETSKNAMKQQQLKYEYEKKELINKLEQEKKLSALKLQNEQKNARKNRFMYVLIFLAVILILSIAYLYKFFQQKTTISANKNNELKQKLLLTQMNPHFIFNSIDNIQSLIYNQQNKEAIKYLSKFSKLTRQILENSTENYITLTEEIAMTDNYLMIQQLLYNNNFEYSITVDETINTDSVLLPPMLTQPFIENAVKHGLKSKIENGIINIRFSIDRSALVFEVTDNGIGFSDQEKQSDHRSMAMNITKERLVNYTKKDDFSVQAENVKDATGKVVGAKVLFEIPYIYDN